MSLISKFGWKSILLLSIANLVALLLKLLVSQQGSTYDFESYLIVSDLVREGKNVYSETQRYNYGPVWFLILGALRSIWESPRDFHYALVIFLGLNDCILSFIFARSISYKAGLIFAINPISIIITGYYVQFDAFAILLGISGLQFLSFSRERDSTRSYVICGLLLGLSLCTKHLLIFLPVCLILRNFKVAQSLYLATLTALIAYLIFLISFIPFLTLQNISLIFQNVFLYQSVHNIGLIRGMFEEVLGSTISSSYLFAMILLIGTLSMALLNYQVSQLKFLALHLAALFCLLPGVAPQYLVYLLPLWLFNLKNIYFGLAVAISTALLIAISPGLQVDWLDHRFFRLALIQLLVVAALAAIELDKLRSPPYPIKIAT